MYCVYSVQYYTEGVFMSSGNIYSTLFDAHIIFMFSRQYHINCLSIQKHVQFHICIYFRFLAVCIALIATHIFSIFGRLYHINSHFFVYAWQELF